MKKTRWKISAVGILQSLLFYLFAAGYKYTQRSKTYRQYNYYRHPLQNRSYRLISDSPENKTGGPTQEMVHIVLYSGRWKLLCVAARGITAGEVPLELS